MQDELEKKNSPRFKISVPNTMYVLKNALAKAAFLKKIPRNRIKLSNFNQFFLVSKAVKDASFKKLFFPQNSEKVLTFIFRRRLPTSFNNFANLIHLMTGQLNKFYIFKTIPWIIRFWLHINNGVFILLVWS